MPTLGTILCVDDEPDVLLVTQLCLETMGGFTVIPVDGGREALASVAQAVPDLVLLDIMMPGMDGPTTLKALREIDALAATPIIFMTARVRPSEVEEYLAMGANGVVAKPFDPATLCDEITQMWERFHAR